MKNLFRYVGVGAVSLASFALVLTAQAAGEAVAPPGGFDDFGGSIFDSVSLDLKVNGQDGPVTVGAGSRIVVSWISEGAARCRGNWSRNDIKSSGTVAGRLSRSVVIKAACIDKEGNRDDDSVVVNVEGKAQIPTPVTTPPVPQPTPTTSAQPTITVLNPNGGETYRAGSQLPIAFSFSPLSFNSIPVGTNYDVSLVGKAQDRDIGYALIIASDIQKSSFTIPTDIAPGSYGVRVVITVGSKIYQDQSDSLFTITAPTTSAQKKINIEPQITADGFSYTGQVGVEFSKMFIADAAVEWDIPNIETKLPPGLSLVKFGAFSAQIKGTPTKSGTYIFDLISRESASNGVGTVTVRINITAPTTTTTQTTTSGNVGTGNVGTAIAPSLSATAPTIAGTRTPAGDKLYPGSMSITATISNSGGQLTTPISARFQYSPNNGNNWYDFMEVGPVSTTPRNVSHTWDGGSGSFCFRLALGTGTDNVSPSSCIEIIPKEGAFIGLSRELAAAGVPDTDVWAFVKRWLGR